MSNFWNTSDGASAAENAGTEFDSGGGSFVLIPDGSTVLASIDEAGWDTDEYGNAFIALRWDVAKPAEVGGTKVFQKLWCKNDDPRVTDEKKMKQKRDKALRMLASIDANAGGKLARAGDEPDDDALALALTGKLMAIKVMVWEMNGNSGNWVSAVFPKTKEISLSGPVEAAPAKAKPGPKTGRPPSFDDDLTDDVPF